MRIRYYGDGDNDNHVSDDDDKDDSENYDGAVKEIT